MKRFTGFSIEQTKSIPLRKFIGFSLESVNNFVIRVVDNLGNLVPDATVEVTYSGSTSTYTAANGVVSLFIENPVNSIRVEAFKDCLLGEPVFTSHGGEGFNVAVDITIGELPCLNEDVENRFNFIRWQLSNNLSFPLDQPLRICTNCNDVNFDIPNGIQRPIQKECIPYTPLMMRGEKYSFFTNFDEDLTFVVLQKTPLRVGILEEGESIFTESHPCSLYSTQGRQNFYSEFTLGQVTYGYYRLVVYNSSTNAIYAISNLLHVKPNSDKKRTALIKYRNSDNIDGFAYNELPDFYNQIRIDLYQGDSRNYEPEVEEENQVVTAEKRYISIANRLGIPVVSEFLDSEAQDALESFLAHDEIYVNGKRYNARAEDLSYDQLDQAYNFYRANYVLYDYSYARNNRYK